MVPAGCVVIAGATAAPVTVSVAAADAMVPELFVASARSWIPFDAAVTPAIVNSGVADPL